MKTYAWRGDAVFELAFVDLREDALSARGTQLRPGSRLTYVLETAHAFVSERLQLELEDATGVRALDLRRGSGIVRDDVLDFDLEDSPLFNSLPVLRDRLLDGGDARTYTMAFVHVPSLAATKSEQRYVPLERGVVRFRSGDFSADIEFDADGFVVRYPGIGERVS
jgi:uncharacterized protein